MAASLRNFTLSDSEHCELRVFTATCTGSVEPLDHVPRWTVPNSPEPSFCEILRTLIKTIIFYIVSNPYLISFLLITQPFFFSKQVHMNTASCPGSIKISSSSDEFLILVLDASSDSETFT